jgi:protein SPT2
VPGVSKKKDAPRGGALLDTRPPRYGGGAQRSRYDDDYDEELDDFIDYDEDEDEAGGRHHYDSDGSSDMEAGLGDIDEEEYRAEVIARREDQREEKEEAARKRAKEDRKRQQTREMERGRR